MCVEKLEESGQVPERTNFGKTQKEKSSESAHSHLEGICEDTVSMDTKQNLASFNPIIRSGEWSDIGSRDHMEDTHVCISDLAEKFGYNTLAGEVVSFFGYQFLLRYTRLPHFVTFNGLNYPDWLEQIQFHLDDLDLDLAIQSEMPAAITDTSNTEEISFHKTWERSNRLSSSFMRITVANNIKSTIPKTDNAKEFMDSVKECSQSEAADKSLAWILIVTLTIMKFDGSRSMHEHVTEIYNITAGLKTIGMEVSESFLVQFIINSSPSEFGQLKTAQDKLQPH